MKALCLIGLVLLIGTAGSAQRRFNLKNYSKSYDIRIAVANCDHLTCSGRASFAIYKKGHRKPFQVIKVTDSDMDLLDREELTGDPFDLAVQTAIIVGDFNFDGSADVAINGSNGIHRSWNYQIYLFEQKTGKFVHNRTISRQMGKHLALSELDEKKKVLRTFGQDEQGHYLMEEYSVINLHMVKVLIETREMIENQTKVKIITKRLVKRKWETKIELVNPEDLHH